MIRGMIDGTYHPHVLRGRHELCGVAITKPRQTEYRRDLRALWNVVGVIYRILSSTCYLDFLVFFTFPSSILRFSFCFLPLSVLPIVSSDLLT